MTKMIQNPEMTGEVPQVSEFYSHRIMAFAPGLNKSDLSVPVLRRTVGAGHELEGLWEFAGGKQDEEDENPQQTVIREFGEEMGKDKPLTIVSDREYDLPMRHFVTSKGIGKLIMPTVQFGVTNRIAVLPTGDQHDRLSYIPPSFIVRKPRRFTPDTVAAAVLWSRRTDQSRII